MIFILLGILCSVAIANLLMLYRRNGMDGILPVFLGNYLMASGFSYAALPVSGVDLNTTGWALSVLGGMLFLGNFALYQKNILCNGLSLAVSVMRVGMVIPVLLAVVVFREKLGVAPVIGIILVAMAFISRAERGERHGTMWLVALFVVSGVTDAILKVFKESGGGNEAAFVWVIFTSAGLFTLAYILIRRVKIPWQALLFGLALGIPNRFSTVFFLKGLDSVPAAIAYPLTAGGIVLTGIISDVLFWKKRLKSADWMMYGLLCAGIVLLNL